MKTRSPVRAARRQGGTRDAAARQGWAIRGRPRLEQCERDRLVELRSSTVIGFQAADCPGGVLVDRRRDAAAMMSACSRRRRRRSSMQGGFRSRCTTPASCAAWRPLARAGRIANRQRAGRSRPTGHTNAPPGRPSPIEPRKPCPFFAAESWRGCCDRPYPASPSSRGLGRGPFKAKTWVRIPLGTPLDSQTPFRRCVGFGVAAAIDLFRHQRRADAALTVPNRKDPHFVLTWNVVDVMSRRSQ